MGMKSCHHWLRIIAILVVPKRQNRCFRRLHNRPLHPECGVFAGCLLSLLAVLLVSAAPTAAAERPNVIFLLADDLGSQDCGFMGGKEIQTPHLDRLAA